MYADVEAILCAWIEGQDAQVRAVTELPADLLAALADLTGIAHVVAFGGAAINPAMERVHLDVDFYVGPDPDGEPDRAAARDLADAYRGRLLTGLSGYSTAAATVQAVVEMSRPTERPWDESPVRRFSGAYRLVVATRG